MMTQPTASKPRVLLDGLAMAESPRWHDGRLWFAHWGVGEIIAVDLAGNAEVAAPGHQRLGWSIDWLPDGTMLVTGEELSRLEPDGTLTQHADLSGIDALGWNEIVVDSRGNIYVNGMTFNFMAGEPPEPGVIALVTPDGQVRQVADGIEFPNGMVVTPDNRTLVIAESFGGRLTAFDIEDDGSLTNRRVWADRVGPDGICLDAEGAIWAQSLDVQLHTGRDDSPAGEVLRVREGGEILQRIQLDRPCFAVALGGADRRTLFMLAADWRGVENVDAMLADRTGQVLVMDAPAPTPGVGYP
jgi:sugar lactone lactonase YvrE